MPAAVDKPDKAAAAPPAGVRYRVIICIMPAGRGAEMLQALRSETGVISAYTHHARGIGTHSLRHRIYSDEKQIFTVLVEDERADEVFHFLYYRAGLDTPHAGMIMMGRAARGAGVVPLPEAASGGA
ncbi:MAG: hypothetical protein A2V78_03700 [Betaproteobacteria bacterium RBG_16_64_18]|nr:MAG: hypothetical protein A2V78_03700 [Betaproteobacteria bacterium RBG_16_64_18]OGA16373.1 MAG: hypothetical protein A3H33_01120 [Betaproteobacteria bacterium RIFCSPLOWO2_02_FULL_65_20]OGA37413.1 MAG: hypothetical protein A3G26_05015 [Betaproteobacteria bacterium RIFCSPLOWO2_12_FULL_65_110]